MYVSERIMLKFDEKVKLNKLILLNNALSLSLTKIDATFHEK